MKIFLSEEDSDKVLDFFVQSIAQKDTFFVPTLFQIEFLNVVKIKKIDFESSFTILSEYLDTIMQEILSNKALMKKALEISRIGSKASGYPSIYDSIYHALAVLYHCDFITADKKHYEKTKKIGNILFLGDLDT